MSDTPTMPVKRPGAFRAVLAIGAAIIAGSGGGIASAAQNVLDLTLARKKRATSNALRYGPRRYIIRLSERAGLNQRQLRKRARQRWAAGAKNAFAKTK